jgi:CubicO group peptidase (beta-lactamase class C family)
MLERAVRQGVAPAVQVVVLRGAQTLFEAAVGTDAFGHPLTPHHRFDLASLTKPMVTLVWARRWVRGLDDLDAEIPGLPHPVTIRGILRHDSGLPAHRRFDQQLGQIRPGTWAAYHRVLQRCRQTPARPDGRVRYSDLGFILLGDRLEQTGQRLGAQLMQAFPGLETFDRRDGPGRPVDRWTLPAGPRGWVHDDNARAMGGVGGQAGAFGSARTVAGFAAHCLRAWSDSGAPDAAAVRALWTEPGPRGLGFDRPTPGGTAPGWPEDSLGHLGYTGTSLWIHPSSGLAVVLLSNRVQGNPGSEGIRRLRQQVHRTAWHRWGPNREGAVAHSGPLLHR